MENTRLKIKEALDYRNEKNHGEMSRIELGEILFPDLSVNTREKNLSNWNCGKMNPTPTVDQIKLIALTCGVSVDFLIGINKYPRPYPLLANRTVYVLQHLTHKLNEHYNSDECEELKLGMDLLKDVESYGESYVQDNQG